MKNEEQQFQTEHDDNSASKQEHMRGFNKWLRLHKTAIRTAEFSG